MSTSGATRSTGSEPSNSTREITSDTFTAELGGVGCDLAMCSAPNLEVPVMDPPASSDPAPILPSNSSNNLSCEAVLNDLRCNHKTFVPSLFAMSVGLPPEHTHEERVNALIASKTILKKDIKMNSDILKNEILRRSSILTTKKVRPAAWLVPDKMKWLHDHQVPQHEALLISCEIEKYIAEKVSKKTMDEALAAARGDRVGEDKKRKLRLFEAIFDDSLRKSFLAKDDSKSRQAVDARNSRDRRVKSFWELVAAKFNDPDFTPHSRTFPEFDSKLSVSFPLFFDKTLHKDMTPEDAKRIYMDARCMLNKAIKGWRKSGNGSGSLKDVANNPNGNASTEKQCLFSNVANSDGQTVTLLDDRFDFCSGCLWLGYFWCLVDQVQLVDEVSANISSIGASSDKPVSNITKIRSHQNHPGKRELQGVQEIQKIKRTILKFQNETKSARQKDRLHNKVNDCRDSVFQCENMVQSA